MSNTNQKNSNQDAPQNGNAQLDAADASTNTFPTGFQAIATAYGDYTKKSATNASKADLANSV